MTFKTQVGLIGGSLLPFETNTKTPRAMETEIGYRLAQLRLSRNITQSMLAKEAGIGLRTLRRLEAGEPATLDTFLRVAIALDLGDAILAALPAAQIRPIERVSRVGTQRRRARPRPPKDRNPAWKWGDNSHD